MSSRACPAASAALAAALACSCSLGGAPLPEPTTAAPAPPSAVAAEPAAPEPEEDMQAYVAALDHETGEIESLPRAELQWRHIASAARDGCRESLRRTGAQFLPLPDTKAPDPRGCGIPHGVIVTRGPTGIAYAPPLRIDCSLALRLVDIERIVQAEAEEHLESPIARIGTVGSFACREVRGRKRSWAQGLSEHAFGNAIDFSSFETRRGLSATFLRHYKPGDDALDTAEGRFLRAVEDRLFVDGRVTHVYGPESDVNHRGHLHIDCGMRPLL